MTTIFWISLGLSAARWAWTELQRWRDKGVIELQERVIREQKERNVTLAMDANALLKQANDHQAELLVKLQKVEREFEDERKRHGASRRELAAAYERNRVYVMHLQKIEQTAKEAVGP